MFLFPCDPLRPRRPDEHFAAEYAAAREIADVALVDHDAVASGDAVAGVRRVPPATGAVYRGWMLRSEQYTDMAAALAAREVTLRTPAPAYRAGHELPGWYEALAPFTPTSVWTAGADRAGFDVARAALGSGPAVLRDWCKSMKHHWHEAAFVPEVADADGAWAVATRFSELREEAFCGGFVLRRFERFVGAELRTWWIDGACRLTTAHPDTPGERPDADPEFLGPAIAALGLQFVTVDLARHEDGRWRVVELGDGQVSDRPRSTPPRDLIAALR